MHTLDLDAVGVKCLNYVNLSQELHIHDMLLGGIEVTGRTRVPLISVARSVNCRARI